MCKEGLCYYKWNHTGIAVLNLKAHVVTCFLFQLLEDQTRHMIWISNKFNLVSVMYAYGALKMQICCIITAFSCSYLT